MINAIKEKLKEIDSNVQYGICRKKDTWDCLLVRKDRIAKSKQNRLDNNYYISVSIIREDEIPNGTELLVEKKMKEIGFNRTQADARYDYVLDANDVTVEICVMEFVKSTKRECC